MMLRDRSWAGHEQESSIELMEKTEFWLNPVFYYYCKKAATGSFELLLSRVSFLVSKSGASMQKEQTAFPLISKHYFGDFLLLCIYGKVPCEARAHRSTSML